MIIIIIKLKIKNKIKNNKINEKNYIKKIPPSHHVTFFKS